jgi:hypothetical protein
MIMPITTKYHQRMKKYYIPIEKPELYKLKTPQLIINQTKNIDPKRLQDKLSERKLPP